MIKFILHLLLIFPILIYSQKEQNFHILNPNSILAQLDKNQSKKSFNDFTKRQFKIFERITQTLDTLNYVGSANFNTDFGLYSQDVMFQFFQAPADMIIKGVGFSCADDAGVQDSADISVRIVKLNWTWDELSSISEKTYMGYYPAEGDSFNNFDYFGENATGEWIDITNGVFPLPPWTNNIDPSKTSFEYDTWSDEGTGVKVIPEKQESAGNYQWVETKSLGFEPEIMAGNPLFQALSNIVIPSVEIMDNEIPPEIKLYQNYPNPFNPSTVIRYQIPFTVDSLSNAEVPQTSPNRKQYISLKIYDILGCEVATLVDEKQKPGNYEVEFNGENLSSGIYFYKLITGGKSTIRKMILMK